MKPAQCLLIFCLFFCCWSQLDAFEGRRWSRSAVNRYAQEVWAQKHWTQIDEGFEDSAGNEIISVSFKCCETLDLSEARHLLVNELDKIFTMIRNSQSKAISKTNGPFALENISFALVFRSDVTKSDGSPVISLASYSNGSLHYFTKGPHGRKKIHEETVEEALKILKPKGS
ncbi:MAG: hypothetical protein Q8K75_01715 [Chlamydiales bacterium]|nr:hypothetical protein [Chlamydiales bacterium]